MFGKNGTPSRMSSPHWLALAHDLRLGDALRLGEVVHMNTHELSDERLQWLFLSRTPGGHPCRSWAEFMDKVPQVPEVQFVGSRTPQASACSTMVSPGLTAH